MSEKEQEFKCLMNVNVTGVTPDKIDNVIDEVRQSVEDETNDFDVEIIRRGYSASHKTLKLSVFIRPYKFVADDVDVEGTSEAQVAKTSTTTSLDEGCEGVSNNTDKEGE